MFSFDLFTTTSYGYTISHQISSTNSDLSIPPNSPVTGLETITDGQFTVDSSTLKSYTFFIYGEIDNLSPTVYAFSNQATINIICGSETII